MFVAKGKPKIQEENANLPIDSAIPWNMLMFNLGKLKNRRNQEISGNIFKASIVLIDCVIHHVINPRAFSKLNVRQLIEITNSVVTGCSTLWNTHYLMTWFFWSMDVYFRSESISTSAIQFSIYELWIICNLLCLQQKK